jgi:translation initiation factor IF-2
MIVRVIPGYARIPYKNRLKLEVCYSTRGGQAVSSREGERMAEETREKKLVGKVIHFFGKIGVAAIELSGTVKVGDTIAIEGATSSFEQTVDSMQIEKSTVQQAGAGESIGIKVKERVRPGDSVFVVE